MPTLVQSQSGTATTGTTLTLTLGLPTTARNCLVVCFGSTENTTNPNLTGITLGASADNFARAKQTNTAGVANADIWTDQDCAGGQTSIVLTFTAGTGGGTGIGVWVEEWSGIALTAAVDKTNSSSGSTTSWSSGSTGTLTNPNEVIVGCSMGFATGITFNTPSAPWTELGTLTAGTTNRMAAGWQTVTATTAQTYNSTLSGTGPSWAAAIVTLKAAANVVVTSTLPSPAINLSPYPLNLVTGSYVYTPQNPANIPSITFASPNIATVTATASTGSEQVNYTSSPQFPLHLLQSIPQYLRLSVFAATPPSSPKAGASVQGLTASVNIVTVTGNESVNYSSVQQFPFAANTPWPLPIITPRLKPQRQNQPRAIVPGIKATITVTAQTGSATPNVAGIVSTTSVSAHVGTEFARINYAIPFPFRNYPYPLNLVSNLRPQNPASKPGTYVNGLTATVTVHANFGISAALYYITPQFPFTNLALPLPLRKLRQQNFAAPPQHVFGGLSASVNVRSNFGTIISSPHGNASSVAIAARTGVTKVSVTEIASNIAIVSIAKTTISVRGNTSANTISAKFGKTSVSVTAHGALAVTPRVGSPKVTVNGGSSGVLSASVMHVSVSPHGVAASVTAASVVHINIAKPVGAATMSVLANTGTPKITVAQFSTGGINVKAYVEGVAFTGLLAQSHTVARTGAITVSKTVLSGSVAVKSYIGSAGLNKAFGSLVPLNWSAKLVNPAVG